MNHSVTGIDVVMLGTFAPWQRGTIQARALPLARELSVLGVRCAIVTIPWDMSHSAGEVDSVDGIPIINTRTTSPDRAPFAVMEQLGWVRRLNPSIIHLFKPKGFGGLTASVGKRLKQFERPLVVDSDDWEGDGGWNQANNYSWLQQRVFDWQETSLIRCANTVTAASTLLQQRAIRLRGSVDASSVHLIPNALSKGWSTELCDARRKHTDAYSNRTVLLYSRFAEFPPEWLARFHTALDSTVQEPVTIRLIGNRSRIFGVEASAMVNVEQMGYVARTAIPELLGTGAVAIYPYTDSLITRSKQSVKLLEIMAAGCPIIASDVGDIARTMGGAGVPLTGSDPERFAAETNRLLADPHTLATMGRRGQKLVADSFLFPTLASKLKRIYMKAGLRGRC